MEKTIIEKVYAPHVAPHVALHVVHCISIYNSQDMETTWMSRNGGMDKDVLGIPWLSSG